MVVPRYPLPSTDQVRPIPQIELDPKPAPSASGGLAAWYARHFAPGWSKSWAWQAAGAGLAVPFGPDLINAGLDRASVVWNMPGFDLQTKLWLCGAALLSVLVLRPVRQSNMPAQVEAVAKFYVPRTVMLQASNGVALPVSAQVVPVDDDQLVPGTVAERAP